MITIMTITGLSGTGKTEAAKILHEAFGVMPIISHTTRPKRANEVEGRDYYFLDAPTENIREVAGLLTYTWYGGNQYYALLPETPLVPARYSYVVTESGLRDLRRCRPDLRVIALLVRADNWGDRIKGTNREGRDTERDLDMREYDWVVDNNGSLEEFKEKIMKIGELLCVKD